MLGYHITLYQYFFHCMEINYSSLIVEFPIPSALVSIVRSYAWYVRTYYQKYTLCINTFCISIYVCICSINILSCTSHACSKCMHSTHMHVFVHAQMYMCVHTFIQLCCYTCVSLYVCMYVLYACMYAYVFICIMHTVCLYECMHVYTCMYLRTYACMYVIVYCVCMYIY